MDIKHVLSCNPLQPAYAPTVGPGRPRSPTRRPGWIEHEGGLVEIGNGGDGFAFDNEFPRHTTHLEPFALADRPVTCGEWLAFMDDGGYGRPDLWLSDGWATAQAEALGRAALLVQGRRRLVARSPWAARPARRPRRAGVPRQLLRGRRLRPLGRGPAAHRGRVGGGGRRSRYREGNFLDLAILHPRPTAPGGVGSSATCGSGRRAPTAPTRASGRAAGAVGEYNGKFMVNQYVLRGGSCVHPPGPHPRHLPQLLPRRRPAGPFTGVRAGPRRLTHHGLRSAPSIDVHLSADDLRARSRTTSAPA